jgi:hypothetical protein
MKNKTLVIIPMAPIFVMDVVYDQTSQMGKVVVNNGMLNKYFPPP